MVDPRSRWLRRITLAALSTFFAHEAPAQVGIEGIFKEVSDVSFTTSCWDVNTDVIAATKTCPFGQHAYGFEISFRVRDVPLIGSRMKEVRTVKTLEYRNGQYDSIIEVKQVKEPTKLGLLLELGLGYSQFSGFRSSTPGHDLRGTLREIPAITLYGSLQGRDSTWGFLRKVGVYGGLRTGLLQARDFQVVMPANLAGDTVAVYAGAGEAFQIGVVRGAFVDVDPLTFYVEVANMYRPLPSIRWTTTSGTKIPREIPEGIDFSGRTFSLGVQFSIK